MVGVGGFDREGGRRVALEQRADGAWGVVDPFDPIAAVDTDIEPVERDIDTEDDGDHRHGHNRLRFLVKDQCRGLTGRKLVDRH